MCFKKVGLFAIIASVFAMCAYANNIVASKTYVDSRDDLKVNIAQGTGDNNANVGKTLVVNSSGNLELGTPAATNYVADSITDGVTNVAPSENAVHDALSLKQDQQIGAAPVGNANSTDAGKMLVVGNDGEIAMGGTMPDTLEYTQDEYDAIRRYSTTFADDQKNWPSADADKLIDGTAFAWGLYEKQNRKIGAAPVGNADSVDAGKVLVVGNDGNIAMGTTSATGSYQPYTATANQISGANGTWKSLGTTLDTTDATNYDADNAVKASVIVTAMNTKQTKKTCAGWLDGTTTPDTTHTDANCVLWNLPG